MSDSDRPPMRGAGNTRVFLENLPNDVRKDEIDKEFSMYGKIAKVYLIYDPPGSGFVEYFDPGDAEFAASSMDGADFLGSKLKTQLTRGGVPRGRPSTRRPGGGFPSRGRGFSGGFGDRDARFSLGGRGGGRGRGGGGGFRGGRGGGGGFESRGRGRRGNSFGSSRGFGSPRGGGGFRGGFGKDYGGDYGRGGGRSYSRGDEGSSRGYESFDGSGGYGDRYDDGSMGENGYNKYEKYPKFDKYEKDYDKYDSGYSKYGSSSSEKFSSYGGGPQRKDSYTRSRSPIDYNSEGYRSASPGYQRNRSRSPFARNVRNSYSSRNFEENPKSISPQGSREPFDRSRRTSRNYASDRSGDSSHSYGRKEYTSSSYGGRRSPMEGRY